MTKKNESAEKFAEEIRTTTLILYAFSYYLQNNILSGDSRYKLSKHFKSACRNIIYNLEHTKHPSRVGEGEICLSFMLHEANRKGLINNLEKPFDEEVRRAYDLEYNNPYRVKADKDRLVKKVEMKYRMVCNDANIYVCNRNFKHFNLKVSNTRHISPGSSFISVMFIAGAGTLFTLGGITLSNHPSTLSALGAFAQMGVGIGVLAFAAYLFRSGCYKGLSDEMKSLQTECDSFSNNDVNVQTNTPSISQGSTSDYL